MLKACVGTSVTAGALPSPGGPLATFSVSMFSETRMAVPEHSLSRASAPRDSVSAIRKLYEGKIAKMKPEHPGGRIDFLSKSSTQSRLSEGPWYFSQPSALGLVLKRSSKDDSIRGSIMHAVD